MGIAIKTLGCNGLCRDCYENRIRSVNKDTSYNIQEILATIKREFDKVPKEQLRHYNAPHLHGGEPLLMKFEDIEQLLSAIYEYFGHTGIQTNGTLINDRIIELFKKYRTSVGISLDGDIWQLNQGRWNAVKLAPEKIKEMTDGVVENIRKCRDAGLSVSLITLLRRCNADAEHLPEFIKYLLRMKEEFGIVSIRTNEAIVYEDEFRADELTNEEMGVAFCALAEVCLNDPGIQWLPYRDIVEMMFGYLNSATCVFTECDIWHTTSERAIDRFGGIGNCLKGGGAVDGIQVIATAEIEGERYRLLSQIPQELHGCKDCRFWFMCKGGCPGEGVNNDWRNKTRFCEALKMLYSFIERKVKAIIPNLVPTPEFYPFRPLPIDVQSNLGESGSTWFLSRRKSADTIKETIKNRGIQPLGFPCEEGHGDKAHGDRPHGDSDLKFHGDSSHGDEHGDRPHGDSSHGDRPHGDSSHGDKEHGDS